MSSRLSELKHKLQWQNHLAPFECEYLISRIEAAEKFGQLATYAYWAHLIHNGKPDLSELKSILETDSLVL